MVWKVLTPLLAYLMGNFNSGIVFSKLFFKKDIREHGSKNPGATNAFRVFGKGLGSLVLLFDGLKGFLAVFMVRLVFPLEEQELWIAVAGACVMLGHIFPIIYKFKGGKGVMTTGGVILATDWRVFLTLFIPFCIILFSLRYMSVASLSVTVLLPVAFLAWNQWQITLLFWMGVFQAAVVIFMHRSNIQRLLKRTENRLFQKKDKEKRGS